MTDQLVDSMTGYHSLVRGTPEAQLPDVNLMTPALFLVPPRGYWLTYDHQVPGGVRLSMEPIPLLSRVVGYFYMYGPAHGTEQVHGDPLGQEPPDGWILAPGWWYQAYWIKMVQVAQGPDGTVVPLTIAECTFHVGQR